MCRCVEVAEAAAEELRAQGLLPGAERGLRGRWAGVWRAPTALGSSGAMDDLLGRPSDLEAQEVVRKLCGGKKEAAAARPSPGRGRGVWAI